MINTLMIHCFSLPKGVMEILEAVAKAVVRPSKPGGTATPRVVVEDVVTAETESKGTTKWLSSTPQ